jgi:hypothetical protein
MSASITFEESQTYENTSSSTTVAFPSLNVSAGECIVVGLRWEGGGLNDAATASVTDSIGNSYVVVDTEVTGSSGQDTKVVALVCLSSSGTNASNVVTATISSSRSYRSGVASVFSYTGTIEVGDTGSGNSDVDTTSITTSPALDSNSGDITLGFFGNYNDFTSSPLGGFTEINPSNYASFIYKIATGTGTESPAIELDGGSGADEYAAVTFVLQEVGNPTLVGVVGTTGLGSITITGDLDVPDEPIELIAHASANLDNDASGVVSVPTGTLEDHVMIAMFSVDGDNKAQLPVGFTELQNAETLGSHGNVIGYRVATASEPASYTFSPTSGSERAWACIATYSGVDPDDPIDQSNSNTGGANLTGVLTSITPSTDDCAVVVFAGTERGRAGGALVSSNTAGITIQNNNTNGPPGTGAASSAGAFGDVIQTTAAAVSGNFSFNGSNTNWGVMAVVLNPVPSGGGGSALLTGVQATGSVGNLTIQVDGSTLLTGVSASGTVGTITVSTGIAQILAGVQASGAVGDLTIQADASEILSGVSGSGAVGTLGIQVDTAQTLSGVNATGGVGNLTISTASITTASLIGVEATGQVGELVTISDAAIVLSGVSGTGSVGTLTISTAENDAALLTGVEGVGQVGALTVLSNATLTLTGVQATGAVGDIATLSSSSAVLSGVVGTGAIGTLSINTDTAVTLLGNQAVGAVGDIVIGGGTETVPITGVSATGEVGTIEIGLYGSWVIQNEDDGSWSVQSQDSQAWLDQAQQSDNWSSQTEDETTWTDQDKDDSEWT